MRKYDRTHLGDGSLLQSLKSHAAAERTALAELLADLAEVDDRRLYIPAGYPSMFEYCLRELGFSEDAAYKRIQAARCASKFPVLFEAIGAGRLHLTAVVLLGPHISECNAADLIEEATGKTKAEIQKLLAVRNPRPDVPTVLKALPAVAAPRCTTQPAEPEASVNTPTQLVPEPVGTPAAPRGRIEPLAAKRFALQTTIDEQTHAKLQYARDLLSHRVPSGDLAQILNLALDALISQTEKSRFAPTDKPRQARHSGGKRTIPAHVRREVWNRDHGRCTFVSDSGKRCDSRRYLEFDHVEPVARGGRATISNTRLRCRSHNQYEADRAFGAGFMQAKRGRATPAARPPV